MLKIQNSKIYHLRKSCKLLAKNSILIFRSAECENTAETRLKFAS